MFPDLHENVDSLVTLDLVLTQPLPLSEALKQKYPTLLEQVGVPEHVSSLVGLCELLGILDDDPTPRFVCTHYTRRGIWPGLKEVWEIHTRSLRLARNFEQELSESWSSVDDLSNTITLQGLPRNMFMDWRGELHNQLTLTLGGISPTIARCLESVVTPLFGKIDLAKRAYQPDDWLRISLLLERRFKNPLPGPLPAEYRPILAELLADPESDVALAALEKLQLGRTRDDLDQNMVHAFLVAIDSSRGWVAEQMLSEIGVYRPSSLLVVVLHALNNRSEEVQAAALFALSHFQGRHDLIPSIGEMLQSPRIKVRRAALCALHELAGPTHRLEYLEHYKSAMASPVTDLRSLAIRFLREMREPSNFDVLISALSDSHEGVRRTACAALRELGDPAAIPALTRLFNDRGQYLPKEARQAVEALREKQVSEIPP